MHGLVCPVHEQRNAQRLAGHGGVAVLVRALHDDGRRLAQVGQHVAGGHLRDDDLTVLEGALQVAERVDVADLAARAARADALAAQQHVAHNMRLDQVGRTGDARGHTGGDNHDVARLDHAGGMRHLDRRADHLIRVGAHLHARRNDAVAQPELMEGMLAGRRRDDRAAGMEARDHARGRAGVARRDDRGGIQILRHRAAGVGNRVGNRAHRRGLDDVVLNHVTVLAQAACLDEGGDAHHRVDSLDRVFACGGLAGEHDRVGAVDDGVGDVARLGARRARIADHRVEHLRRRDDGLRRDVALVDELLLQHGHLFHVDLDAQIAARDHDAVGDLEDLVEVVHAHAVFDLGEDLHMAAAVVRAELADGQHVAGPADERGGDQVDALLDAKEDVAAVLLADGGHLQIDIGHGDALAAAQHAAIGHAANDVGAVFNAHDLHRQQAVVDEHVRAGPDQLDHLGIGDGDLMGVALDLAAGQDELRACLQRHLAALDGLGAHLRPLRIQQDRNRDALLLAQALDARDARPLLLIASVGHIQTAHVHSRIHQLGDHLLAVAGGAERADDFGLSHQVSSLTFCLLHETARLYPEIPCMSIPPAAGGNKLFSSRFFLIFTRKIEGGPARLSPRGSPPCRRVSAWSRCNRRSRQTSVPPGAPSGRSRR